MITGKITVFANGCFDVLHYGHIILLEGASKLGDRLIVALNSDKSIRELKGSDRPIYPEKHRVEMLRAIRYVDDVMVFDNEEELAYLIRAIKPDIVAKGPDWNGQPMTYRDDLDAYGGQVKIVPVDVNSTTAIIQKCIESTWGTGT